MSFLLNENFIYQRRKLVKMLLFYTNCFFKKKTLHFIYLSLCVCGCHRTREWVLSFHHVGLEVDLPSSGLVAAPLPTEPSHKPIFLNHRIIKIFIAECVSVYTHATKLV